MHPTKLFTWHHCRYELRSLSFSTAHQQPSLQMCAAFAALPEKAFAK
jgi:hypothetical protein